MAGHFLTEASKAGFEVNAGVLKKWKGYQQKMSQVFRVAGDNFFSYLDEAYRLYTMALSGDAQVSGMNRLKEAAKIGDRARYMLAAAYALSGKATLGQSLLEGNGKDFPEYEPYNITYGTGFRDKMVAMDALVLCGNLTEALAVASEPADRYMSTQETAFASVAYRHLYDKVPTGEVKVNLDGKTVSADKSLSVPVEKEQEVKNLSQGIVYGTLVKTQRTAVRTATSNGLKLEIKYSNPETGATVNPASLPQGTRFLATIKVINPSAVKAYENLALNFPVPSGWEIQNERLTGGATDEDGYDHKDIRDDRVNWFFALPAGHSKTFTVQLRAAYEGRYMLPSTVAEAMYEPAVQAASASGTAVVTR